MKLSPSQKHAVWSELDVAAFALQKAAVKRNLPAVYDAMKVIAAAVERLRIDDLLERASQ